MSRFIKEMSRIEFLIICIILIIIGFKIAFAKKQAMERNNTLNGLETIVWLNLPIVEPSEEILAVASWYDYDLTRKDQKCRSNDCYSMFNSTCASRDYEKGTILKVINIKNGLMVECRVNDYIKHPDRDLDLSSFAFSKIADLKIGLIEVIIIK